jgi:molecular chaperone DnaK (HSP70)
LPCESSQTFYTVSKGQTAVEVTITQGEDTTVEYVNKIATHKFELPPDRPAECPIKVTYSYDVNQRMHCKFEDLESGRVLAVDLSLNKNGQMSADNIAEEEKQLNDSKVK